MGIFDFSDAKAQLKQRIGNRNDITDAMLGKYINQSQHVMATNIRGIDIFDMYSASNIVAGRSDFRVNEPPPDGLGLEFFWAFETILDVTDSNNRRRLYRGEWEMDLHIAKKPVAPPTLWHHLSEWVYFNTVIDKPRKLEVYYRRTPILDTIAIPDEWFEHLINLACVFVYPTIGRNSERDQLFAKMPQSLQIAMLNPLTPSQWESMADPGLAIYSEW